MLGLHILSSRSAGPIMLMLILQQFTLVQLAQLSVRSLCACIEELAGALGGPVGTLCFLLRMVKHLQAITAAALCRCQFLSGG